MENTIHMNFRNFVVMKVKLMKWQPLTHLNIMVLLRKEI